MRTLKILKITQNSTLGLEDLSWLSLISYHVVAQKWLPWLYHSCMPNFDFWILSLSFEFEFVFEFELFEFELFEFEFQLLVMSFESYDSHFCEFDHGSHSKSLTIWYLINDGYQSPSPTQTRILSFPEFGSIWLCIGWISFRIKRYKHIVWIWASSGSHFAYQLITWKPVTKAKFFTPW